MKLNSRGPKKSSHSDAQAESKPDSSLRFKITRHRGKMHMLKSKSRTQKVDTNIPRKKVTDSSIKGPSKVSSTKKLTIKQSSHKADGKFPQNMSSNLQPKKVREKEKDDGEVKLQKIKRRRKKKRQRNNVNLDDASRLQRRTRYLIIKMKLEQNLIDAYSAEGWKGQSREKIRPEKELQRAQKQILKCKLGIRDAIRQLDSLSGIEDPVIAPDGSAKHKHIFCAKCKLCEALPDNDIVLCHGTCSRAFHQKCLDPPLASEHIPPEGQGWFCKFCDCKMRILEVVNAHLGTHFSLHSTSQDVFKDEAAMPDGDTALPNPGEEWPSDDSEDEDYNPERREGNHNINNTEGTDDDASDDVSSSASLWSYDSECSPVDERVNHEYFSVNSSIDSDESKEKACGRRHRKAVDYKKLYDEMFGKDAPAYEQVSEDEDWGPSKRKRREKESDAVNTLMTLHECENKHPNNEHHAMIRDDSSGIQIRKPCFRFPPAAIEKLRQVFAENELPPRSTKVDLSKEFGLSVEKVSKWFKNARYVALKARKQVEGADQVHSFTPRKNSTLQNMGEAELLKSKASKITVNHSTKNVKNVTGKMKTKSDSSTLMKRQAEIFSPQPSENVNKDVMEISDDVSLKKLLKKRKRKAKFTFEGGYHEAELEFERLSKVKIKLDSMKQKLSAIQNYRGKGSDEPQSNEPSTIFVPIAVLREKVEL
ncbi:PREDICTED: pathogenesis-related homeodomain protein-like isoform X2 [Lupinus angustifolius]|uniref:pathogenesis-related homeodomain protein-like isoform X2 n=1 Tax=Lupinus angustifolius TaxID=3871 RepID=UPI00092EA34A|nr:PREDICTED: pathogenesis-related homeodomain protein-like isoform X2 [Lupinus angustifolius]